MLTYSRARAFATATHFPQALAMVLLATVSALLIGTPLLGALAVLFATAAGQATIGWTNDFHDAETDMALGRGNKPLVRGELRREELVVPIFASATITVVLSLIAAGLIGGIAHILAVASAVAYNFWLSRTIWSWLPYAVSFGLLPVFVAQSASPTWWPSVGVVSCSVSIGVIAHVLNAIPDVEIDKQAGLGGLAVSMGKTVSWIFVIALIGVTTPGVIAVFVEFISAMK